LRERFGSPNDALIVPGVGYEDLRKGRDLFVEVSMEVTREVPEACFIRVENFDPGRGLPGHLVFPGYDADTDRYYAGANIYGLTFREDPFPSVGRKPWMSHCRYGLAAFRVCRSGGG